MDVADELQEIGVFLAKDSLVAGGEEVADSLMAVIEEAGVACEGGAHDLREWELVSFDEEMKMIGHEGVGVKEKRKLLSGKSEGLEKLVEVLLIEEDGLAVVAAGDNVVESTGKLDAGFSGHERNKQRNNARLTPLSPLSLDYLRFRIVIQFVTGQPLGVAKIAEAQKVSKALKGVFLTNA
jgi:hypothetical protein